jgi:hypothetical protein
LSGFFSSRLTRALEALSLKIRTKNVCIIWNSSCGLFQETLDSGTRQQARRRRDEHESRVGQAISSDSAEQRIAEYRRRLIVVLTGGWP